MRAVLLLAISAATAHAESPTDFTAWEEAYQFDCNGPWAHFGTADVKSHDGFRFSHTGATVKVTREKSRAGRVAKLGLLAGIKDLEPDTEALLKTFLADFEKADVDLIVIGGDTAEEPDVLDKVYGFLVTATRRPMLAIAGNTERAAAHTYAVSRQRKAGHLHLLNGDILRRYDGEGFDVVTLAGYYDKKYLHLTGGCQYSEKAVGQVADAAAAADDAVLLLSHGPPRQSGKQAIDFVPGAGNVGDPALTEVMKRAKISFGIFGHIIEAGGLGTDVAGQRVPQKKLVPALLVDQGSTNPLPWKQNDGTTSYGLAAIVTVDGKKASYEVLRGPKPAPKAE